MIYSDEQLKGLEKPPLVNGEFSIDVWRQWATVNKKHAYQMTFNQWKEYQQKNKKDPLLYLTELKHWFYAVERRIEEGLDIDEQVLQDYLERSK